ncbi:hypothetical protein V6N12_009945 [Hibiscus sabdariffa]|uniref:Uncharacterized protein n=1 Tax=Hibiscus sabdariffa TaxID=183260 RepID=A0ABR2EC77_9ROSI
MISPSLFIFFPFTSLDEASKLDQGTANTTVAFRAVSENETRYFRVDMATSVKCHTIYGYSKRHKIRVGTYVMVNVNGVKVDSDERCSLGEVVTDSMKMRAGVLLDRGYKTGEGSDVPQLSVHDNNNGIGFLNG